MTAVDRVAELSRLDFLETYRLQRPVVVAGAASRTPAAIKWSLPFLLDTIGSAEISVGDYQGDPRDPFDIIEKPLSFRDYAQKFSDPQLGRNLYLFNVETANFWANSAFVPAPSANPGLAVLEPDFEAPAFVRRSDMIYAQLILGSADNGTRLHYDWGGEAKLLIQLRGRKQVTLYAPEDIAAVDLNRMFGRTTGWPGACASEDRGDARAWHTTLEPGDILYWPAFWLHDVVNLDAFTLAINTPLDEARVPALCVRQMLGAVVARVLARLPPAEAERRREALLPMLVELEDELLSADVVARTRLWSWLFDPRQIRGEIRIGGERKPAAHERTR